MEEAGHLVGAQACVISQLANANFEDLSSSTIQQRAPTQINSLLEQLRHCPLDDGTKAIKFGLYEAYSTEVEGMRNTMIRFHGESEPLLPEAISRKMQEEIRGVDARENLSIPDNTQEWFVYHMMRQAERNNLAMAGKLESFEKKIRYLAESAQTECPVCLENFSVGRPADTLACCHKICRDCWTRWSTVMHARSKHPFCPCCNSQEFIGTVNAEIGCGVDMSDSDGDSFDRSCSIFTRGRDTTSKAGQFVESINPFACNLGASVPEPSVGCCSSDKSCPSQSGYSDVSKPVLAARLEL
jgi:hypothetical protein